MIASICPGLNQLLAKLKCLLGDQDGPRSLDQAISDRGDSDARC